MSEDVFEKVQEIVAEGIEAAGLDEVVLSGEESAAKRLADAVSDEAVDRMIADAKESGISLLDGPDGLVGQLTARIIERALGAEMDGHLGYEKGDPAGRGSGNSRNGHYGKTVTTSAGPVRVSVPRDRNASFEPRIVRKGQRRAGPVDDIILSLYARGLTTRDIRAHLEEAYGASVSPALISNITDVVQDEIVTWQTRPLDAFYAIIYIDALVVKVRDGGMVQNKAAYRNRGVKDVLFVCCDGLKGLPEAIKSTWQDATLGMPSHRTCEYLRSSGSRPVFERRVRISTNRNVSRNRCEGWSDVDNRTCATGCLGHAH